MSIPTKLSDKAWLRPASPMTVRERGDLCQVVRRREKLDKTQAVQRSAELKADVERQLSAIYSWSQDEIWKKAYLVAKAAMADAQKIVADRCVELGIPREFSPGIAMGWIGRGENDAAQRRAELRRLAFARIEAMEMQARTKIETLSVELQEQIVSSSLTSESAKTFLEQMPKVAVLMPAMDVRGLLLTSGKSDDDDSDDADAEA